MNPETTEELSKEELAVLNDQDVPNPDSPAEPEAESAPEPEAQPEPEQQPRTDDGKFAPKGASEAEAPKQEQPKKERKTVPLGELLEERKARQALEEQIKQEAEKRARLEGAFQTLNQRFAQPQEPPKPAPTIDEQPLEVLRQTQAQLTELQRQQQEAQITAQFSQHVRGLAEQFKARVPDYADALKYAGDKRRLQLQAFGMPQMAIEQQLQRDEFELSAAALQQGKNPAEVIYETAKLWGYQPRQAAQAEVSRETARNGPDLATIERGQAAARSLGNAAGAAPDTLTGLDRLAAMSPEELGKLSEAEFRKIMGG